jgi:hypothetical protein
VRDLAGNTDFIVETGQGRWIARGHFGQKLERHLLAQGEVVRPINFSHAAAAEERDDTVTISEKYTW